MTTHMNVNTKKITFARDISNYVVDSAPDGVVIMLRADSEMIPDRTAESGTLVAQIDGLPPSIYFREMPSRGLFAPPSFELYGIEIK